ncbi:MAG: RNA polymerase sigma-70 factor (ECF subfamily) [Alphaproteobacteria bacterium]
MSTDNKRELLIAEIPRLRRYAIALMRDRIAADDLVQDVVLRALDRLHLWRDGTNMRTWLFTIMHNLHANDMRRLSRTADTQPLDAAALSRGTPPEQESAFELSQLADAIAVLPVAQRQVILLVGLEGFSYAEAAEALDVPVGTVMSRLSRTREELRRTLDGENVSQIRRIK